MPQSRPPGARPAVIRRPSASLASESIFCNSRPKHRPMAAPCIHSIPSHPIPSYLDSLSPTASLTTRASPKAPSTIQEPTMALGSGRWTRPCSYEPRGRCGGAEAEGSLSLSLDKPCPPPLVLHLPGPVVPAHLAPQLRFHIGPMRSCSRQTYIRLDPT
jgi:hypothetical protein